MLGRNVRLRFWLTGFADLDNRMTDQIMNEELNQERDSSIEPMELSKRAVDDQVTTEVKGRFGLQTIYTHPAKSGQRWFVSDFL